MAEIVALTRTDPQGPVHAAFEDGVLRVTLASPPANALSLAAMAALQAEMDRARSDDSIRVVVIAASGKVFCAGHDLKEPEPVETILRTRQRLDRLQEVTRAIRRFPGPVIAAVHGHALQPLRVGAVRGDLPRDCVAQTR